MIHQELFQTVAAFMEDLNDRELTNMVEVIRTIQVERETEKIIGAVT
jgi:hypothetical protein